MKIVDIIGLILSAAGTVILGIANMRHAEDAAVKAVDEAFDKAFETQDDDKIE